MHKQLIINIGCLFSFLDHCTPSDGVGGLTSRRSQPPLPLRLQFTPRVGGGWYVFQSYSAGGEERVRALPAGDGE
jgi:hypothetical protein